MHEIQLNDQLYQEAQRRASAAGFATVDDYVADVLHHDLHEETENFDHLFTPERLAHVDRAAAQIDAGQGISAEQVREHFRRKYKT
jgi:PHD/YefM family antitoxin component YafN of YafNO toxin-antitoxin module